MLKQMRLRRLNLASSKGLLDPPFPTPVGKRCQIEWLRTTSKPIIAVGASLCATGACETLKEMAQRFSAGIPDLFSAECRQARKNDLSSLSGLVRIFID